jgi:hypothetical protein
MPLLPKNPDTKGTVELGVNRLDTAGTGSRWGVIYWMTSWTIAGWRAGSNEGARAFLPTILDCC